MWLGVKKKRNKGIRRVKRRVKKQKRGLPDIPMPQRWQFSPVFLLLVLSSVVIS
jgi:hypothetical protein